MNGAILALTVEDAVQPVMAFAQQTLARVLGVEVGDVVAEVERGDNGRMVPHFAVDREKVQATDEQIGEFLRATWGACRPRAAYLVARAREQWHGLG